MEGSQTSETFSSHCRRGKGKSKCRKPNLWEKRDKNAKVTCVPWEVLWWWKEASKLRSFISFIAGRPDTAQEWGAKPYSFHPCESLLVSYIGGDYLQEPNILWVKRWIWLASERSLDWVWMFHARRDIASDHSILGSIVGWKSSLLQHPTFTKKSCSFGERKDDHFETFYFC